MKMVEQRVDLQGQIALAQLDRLQDCLLDDAGEVDVELRFDKDEEGIRTISGSLATEVAMQCQRCLQPVRLNIEAAINLGIVFSEEAAENLPGYYDPVQLESNELALWPLVEEELILSLPISVSHPEGECNIEVSYRNTSDQPESNSPNPFEVLAQLKKKI